MHDVGPALRTKYQRLLEAYQKSKKENQVLKKALITDQETHKFHESVIKEKEVLLRSSVEENDMLTFNNQRLTRRVEQLVKCVQEEKKNAGGGWGSFFSGSKAEIARLNSDLEVMKEQLEHKLEENEGLVSQMCQLRSENEQTVAMLDRKLSEFKKAVKEKEDEIDTTTSANEHTVADLNDQKSVLNQRLAMLDRELEQTRTLMQEREQTMTTINRQLSTDLERTQQLFEHKVAFDDTRVSEYNKMNIPGFDRVSMLRKIEIAEQALSLFETFSRTFRAHDQAYVDRLNLMGRNLSAMSKLQMVNVKITTLLPEHQVHLRNLEKGFKNTVIRMKSQLDVRLLEQLDSEGETDDMAALFKKFVYYHNKMLPYQVLSLTEEARKDTCVPVLQARNYVLVSTQKRLTAALDKLCVYVQLACPTGAQHSRAQEANGPAILKHAHNAANAMLQAFQAYASHLISKISQEHRAPFVLPELKMVNEKVLNSLSTLVSTTSKIVELLGDFVNTTSTPAGYTIRGVECDPQQMSEDVPYMQNRARRYMSLLHKGAARAKVRVPYSEAVRAESELAAVDQIRAELKQQIREAESKAKSAEDRVSQIATRLEESAAANQALELEVAALQQERGAMNAELIEQESAGENEDESGSAVDTEETTPRVSADETRLSRPEQTELAAMKALLAQRDQQLAQLQRENDQMSLAANEPSSEEGSKDKAAKGEGADELNKRNSEIRKVEKQRDEAVSRCKQESAQHSKTIMLMKAEHAKLQKASTLSQQIFSSSSMFAEMEQQLQQHLDKKAPSRKSMPAPLTQQQTVTITDENGRRVDPSLFTAEQLDREELIRGFYKARLCQLLDQAQVADQISLEWRTDYSRIKQEYEECERELKRLTKELEETHADVTAGESRRLSAIESYEKQLKALTDHNNTLKQQLKSK